jgi:hypothetical protein
MMGDLNDYKKNFDFVKRPFSEEGNSALNGVIIADAEIKNRKIKRRYNNAHGIGA